MGGDTPAETLDRRYLGKDTWKEILLQIHLRGDTSAEILQRRFSIRDTQEDIKTDKKSGQMYAAPIFAVFNIQKNYLDCWNADLISFPTKTIK